MAEGGTKAAVIAGVFAVLGAVVAGVPAFLQGQATAEQAAVNYQRGQPRAHFEAFTSAETALKQDDERFFKLSMQMSRQSGTGNDSPGFAGSTWGAKPRDVLSAGDIVEMDSIRDGFPAKLAKLKEVVAPLQLDNKELAEQADNTVDYYTNHQTCIRRWAADAPGGGASCGIVQPMGDPRELVYDMMRRQIQADQPIPDGP